LFGELNETCPFFHFCRSYIASASVSNMAAALLIGPRLNPLIFCCLQYFVIKRDEDRFAFKRLRWFGVTLISFPDSCSTASFQIPTSPIGRRAAGCVPGGLIPANKTSRFSVSPRCSIFERNVEKSTEPGGAYAVHSSDVYIYSRRSISEQIESNHTRLHDYHRVSERLPLRVTSAEVHRGIAEQS